MITTLLLAVLMPSQIPYLELSLSAGALGSGLGPGDYRFQVPSNVAVGDTVYNQVLGNGYRATGSVREMDGNNITQIELDITPTGLSGGGAQSYTYDVEEFLPGLPYQLYQLTLATGQVLTILATNAGSRP